LSGPFVEVGFLSILTASGIPFSKDF